MSNHHIPWFNPREMTDDTVLSLSTGREGLCAEFLKLVQQRLAYPATGGHWLVTGSRGAGKSYFLRLIQANLTQQNDARVRFVLLPEEHQNIAAPHELLLEISRMRQVDKGDMGQPSAWRVADRAGEWQTAKAALLASMTEQLLIVGVENFDDLLKQAFESDEDQSLLRVLLSHESQILFLVTSVAGGFDENYNARLFKQFEHHHLADWTPIEHRIYLQNRAHLVGKVATPRQLARVEAYSCYTGGNPRVAAVLAGAIIDEQEVLLAAADLHATLDKMSDYYRALLQRVPLNSKKILDALIRGGEPCSQSELAQRLGAKQSDIARAVQWLHDYGYIAVQAVKGSKEKPYIMADRLFAQFYRMRYLQPGQQTQLAILSEFLADALELREKFTFAERYWQQGKEPESRLMLTLALQEHRIDAERLPESCRSHEQLMQLVGQILEPLDHDHIALCEKLLNEYNTDESFRAAYQQAYDVLKVCNRFGDELSGQYLADIINSSFFAPILKLIYLRYCVSEGFTVSEAHKLIEINQIITNQFSYSDITGDEYQRELDKQFPTAPNCEYITIYFSYLNPEKALQFDIIALQHRLKNTQLDKAENVLREINRIVNKLHEQQQYRLICELLPKIIEISESALSDSMDLMICIESLASSNQRQDKLNEAILLFNKALAFAREKNATTHIAFNLGKIGWVKGIQGQINEALAAHREALTIQQAPEYEILIAWNAGQIARYVLLTQGLAAAWQELTVVKSLLASSQHHAVQQLGCAIHDLSQQQGLPAAFTVGAQLLDELKAHFDAPYEPFIRALWLDMEEMKIDRRLLRDLTGELVPLYGAEMQPLADFLLQWLDYLDVPVEQREDYLSRLNPDLATTLRASVANTQ